MDAETVLAPGELRWDARGRIVSVRRARGPCDDVVVVPALVNAHVHLQIPTLPQAEADFVPWLAAVMQSRRTFAASAQRDLVRASLAGMRAEGVGALGEIDSTGTSTPELLRMDMPSRSYREVTGFHLDRRGAARLLAERAVASRGNVRVGWSPHAPYSVSPALFAAVAARARHLAVHCAETEAEQRFLHTGRGPFADLLRSLGRLPNDFRAPGCGAVAWLERLGVLRAGTQLVHCQELQRGDIARIAAAGAAIAVCPGTIRYFGRHSPPVPAWLRAGIAVALGTDSRASNTGLSLRAELQLAAQLWPELSPRHLLAMATRHGARSLGLPRAGRLRRGDRADFLVLGGAPDLDTAWSAFVHGEPPRAVWHAGRPVPPMSTPAPQARR